MRRFLAIALVLAAGGPVLAQDIPEGQSCGGLFCDLGIVGHKTAPAPAPAAPAKAAPAETVPGKIVPTVAPVPPDTAVPAEPRKRIVRRKHAAPVAVAAKPAGSESGASNAAGVVPDLTPVAAVPVKATVAARPARRQPPATPVAAPPGDEPVIFMSPASQAPVGKDMFQPIYR